MKSRTKLLLFFATILVLFWLLFQQQPVSKRIKSINSVTHQSDTTKDIAANKNNSPLPKKNDPQSTYNTEQLSIASNDSNNPQLDYITAYRDWQYFENCYTDIEDFNNNKDPLDTLKERFANNLREAQTEPTSQQNIYYQHHVDICKTLINYVGNSDDDYNQILYNLYERFSLITPKTAEEKQLSHAFSLAKELDSLKLSYSKAHRSKSNLSIEEQDALNQQIEQLTVTMMDIYQGNNPLTPEGIIAIKGYSDEIELLQNLLSHSHVVDYEHITYIGSTINHHLNIMDNYLRKVESPDAFLIIIEELFKYEYLQKDSDIMQNLKSQTGILDNYYISILNRIVHPLVACSMDYPCDAQSDLILSYCLGLRDSMFNQACGLGLEDFYFNFYIGANQLDDVNNYFSFLVNRYAN